MAAQGSRLTITGATPAATSQSHLSARPAMSATPATSHRPRRPPRRRRMPSSRPPMPDQPNRRSVSETVIFIPPLVAALSRHRRVGDDLSQEGDHLGAVPFGGTDEAPELPSLRVDQKRGRQAEHTETAGGFATRVQIFGELGDADLAEEGID